jgi:protein-tyrosine phosphatase
MIQNVLVICVGNICRSPIGEALLAVKLKPQYPSMQISSAGLGALVNHPADPISLELMQARGIDISPHRARQATPEILFASELVLTMTTDQQEQIEQQYTSMRGRVHRIGKWSGFDVPDPYRRPQIIFEQALSLIEQGIEEWYERVWK